MSGYHEPSEHRHPLTTNPDQPRVVHHFSIQALRDTAIPQCQVPVWADGVPFGWIVREALHHIQRFLETEEGQASNPGMRLTCHEDAWIVVEMGWAVDILDGVEMKRWDLVPKRGAIR